MKFTVVAEDLAKAVDRAAKAVSTKNVNAVLACVRIVASDNSVAVQGYNLDSGVSVSTPSDVRMAGECVVNPAKLKAALGQCSGEVELSADGTEAVLKCGRNKWKFPSLDPKEFPSIPQPDGGGFTAPAVAVLRAIRQTEYAANRKDNSPRYNVNAVAVEVDDGVVRFVATDTKRLGVGECAVTGERGPKVEDQTLIPLKSMPLIRDVLDKGDGEAEFTITRNELEVRCGSREVYTRLADGRFPQWRNIVPKKADVTMPMGAAEFGSACKAAAVTSDEESCRVDMAFRSGVVTMVGRGAETGASEVVVDLPECEAEFDIAFDPDYVGEMCVACLESESSGTMSAEFSGASKPAVFRWTGGFGLIMPMGDRD